ncbi:transcription factor MYB33-like [Impatiens glandulifera]|uniref:transcription factor MYB33-like n=1 Tax=Impatiens glandulifera TaxID=253017 RepID=UPI001FB135A2|nr:transcription factor MYB33-like [Impatiens glandulifera]
MGLRVPTVSLRVPTMLFCLSNAASGNAMGSSGIVSLIRSVIFLIQTSSRTQFYNLRIKITGLSRCGKSCRLRWLNHLKPNLSKFAITPEEERRIVELHYHIGNKWSRMASELTGRTNNEIKNFSNTRLKRLQRLGQPIYPPKICKAVQESEQTKNKSPIMSGYGSRRYPFHLPAGIVYIDIPTVKFDGLKNNSHPPDYPNFPSFSVPLFRSSNQVLPVSQPAKVFKESVADDPSGIRLFESLKRESEGMEICNPPGQQQKQQKLMPSNSIFDNFVLEECRPLDLTRLSSFQSTPNECMIECFLGLDNVLNGFMLSDFELF